MVFQLSTLYSIQSPIHLVLCRYGIYTPFLLIMHSQPRKIGFRPFVMSEHFGECLSPTKQHFGWGQAPTKMQKKMPHPTFWTGHAFQYEIM